MSALFYTAKRNIIASHTVNTVYSFDVDMQRLDEEEIADRKEHVSLSGDVETWLRRIDNHVHVTTVPIKETDSLCGVMKEFLSSVAGGETFTMDLRGSVAVADNPQFYAMVSTNSKPSRVESQYLTFSFSARKVI